MNETVKLTVSVKRLEYSCQFLFLDFMEEPLVKISHESINTVRRHVVLTRLRFSICVLLLYYTFYYLIFFFEKRCWIFNSIIFWTVRMLDFWFVWTVHGWWLSFCPLWSVVRIVWKSVLPNFAWIIEDFEILNLMTTNPKHVDDRKYGSLPIWEGITAI